MFKGFSFVNFDLRNVGDFSLLFVAISFFVLALLRLLGF